MSIPSNQKFELVKRSYSNFFSPSQRVWQFWIVDTEVVAKKDIPMNITINNRSSSLEITINLACKLLTLHLTFNLKTEVNKA